jgi:hypothetical protein
MQEPIEVLVGQEKNKVGALTLGSLFLGEFFQIE